MSHSSRNEELHALLHRLRLVMNAYMTREELERDILKDLEYIMSISKDDGTRSTERPQQAVSYIKSLTWKSASKIVTESVQPMNAAAITAEFAKLRRIVVNIYDTRLVGPELVDTRTFVPERILEPVRRCQLKVDAYSKL
jgi:hypothetical protein